MGTITAREIAEKAWRILQDTLNGGGVRWPADEVLGWINDGQREVVTHLPTAYTSTAVVTPVAGTRQTMGGWNLGDGLQILRVQRNIAANGTTPGRAIQLTQHALLDAELPAWHSDTAAEARHFVLDPADPKACYIWPAITGGGKLEVTYHALPADVINIDATIVLDDIYANALQYYVLFRALTKRQKQSAGSANVQQGNAYFQLFLQALGVKGARVDGAYQAQRAQQQEA